jgi:hypothetical protein
MFHHNEHVNLYKLNKDSFLCFSTFYNPMLLKLFYVSDNTSMNIKNCTSLIENHCNILYVSLNLMDPFKRIWTLLFINLMCHRLVINDFLSF